MNAPRAFHIASQEGDDMKTTITLLRDYTDKDKVAPQAKVVLDILKEKAGGLKKPLERTVLIEAIEKSKKLTTRQDTGRIVSFYQPKLVDDGIIEVTKVEEAKAPKPPKPAKPSAPGAKKAEKAKA